MKARHKFNAKPTIKNNIRFDSKGEARQYEKLLLLQKSGQIVGFLRQVPIHLKCGIRYTIDFLVFYADGSCEGIEYKGYETPDWVIRHKLALEEYPWLPIKIVKS